MSLTDGKDSVVFNPDFIGQDSYRWLASFTLKE